MPCFITRTVLVPAGPRASGTTSIEHYLGVARR